MCNIDYTSGGRVGSASEYGTMCLKNATERVRRCEWHHTTCDGGAQASAQRHRNPNTQRAKLNTLLLLPRLRYRETALLKGDGFEQIVLLTLLQLLQRISEANATTEAKAYEMSTDVRHSRSQMLSRAALLKGDNGELKVP